MDPLDLVIRNGTVVTAVDQYDAEVGIRGEQIVAIGQNLPAGVREIDASQ